MIDYKHSWEEEILSCKLMRITPPEPIPHPDHIKIDLSTDQVRITGPLTREKKEKWDHLIKMKSAAKKTIKVFEQDLQDPKNKKYKKLLKMRLRSRNEL